MDRSLDQGLCALIRAVGALAKLHGFVLVALAIMIVIVGLPTELVGDRIGLRIWVIREQCLGGRALLLGTEPFVCGLLVER